MQTADERPTRGTTRSPERRSRWRWTDSSRRELLSSLSTPRRRAKHGFPLPCRRRRRTRLPATEKYNAGPTQEAALCPQCAQARQPPSILRTIQLLRGAARTGDGDTGRPVRCRFPVAVPTVPTATATATACTRVLAVVYARPPAHCFVRAAGCWTGRKAAGAPRWSVRCECRSPSPVGGAGALHCIGYLDDGSDRGRAGFN